jgi:hypothetical protein
MTLKLLLLIAQFENSNDCKKPMVLDVGVN